MGDIKKSTLLVLALGLLMGLVLHSFSTVRAASVGDIVINELNYNPESDLDSDEFLELYNTTNSSIDIGGWCFTHGITLCFDSGTTLTAHGYGVISRDATQTLATYGVATVGTYTGKLDNGGERITLVDETLQVIVDFTYDDVSPWPTTPDGTGPSLELKDPTFDYTQASSWSASIGSPTPGQVNSVYGLELPELSDINQPTGVTSTTEAVITVQANNADTVNLTYKVMFNAEQIIAMNDDGVNGDSSANDGVYSAKIPAQLAGALVRYKVEASNVGGSVQLPGNDDTINYKGYTVEDPSSTSQIPVLQWFMEDSARDDMIANHSFDDQKFPVVIAYGDQVFDNARVHIKGGVKRTFDKKSFAIDLPKGHKLLIDDEMTRAVDEFHLDSDYLDQSGTSVTVGWQIAKESGLDTQQVFKVRLQNNGAFYGLYTFLEEDDKTWRQAFGYENMSYYGTDTLKTNIVEDPAYEIEQWRSALAAPRTQERRDYAIDNSDIPNMINYAAFMAIIHNCEWHNGKNMIKVHDVLDTNRWKILAHDIDCTMFPSVPEQRMMNPFDDGNYYIDGRYQFTALYEEMDFRQVYYRRLRTLADEYFANDRYLTMIHDLYDRIQPEVQLDVQKWHYNGADQDALARFTKQYYKTKKDLLVRFRYNNVVPAAQSQSPVITIEDVALNDTNHQEDYIELKNNTNETIDLSGWYIPEVDFMVPYGAGIAPGQSAYIPRHDATFKLTHSGSYVLGQLNQDIPMFGTLSLQRGDSSVSDSRSTI